MSFFAEIVNAEGRSVLVNDQNSDFLGSRMMEFVKFVSAKLCENQSNA